MKYYLEQKLKGVITRVPNAECSSKRAIQEWFAVNEEQRGLDWRVGFVATFRDSPALFTWRCSHNDLEARP
jgi:hypothetical protein